MEDGVNAINRILRDFKTEVVGSINLRLIDKLHSILSPLNEYPEIEVVRGYISGDAKNQFTPNSPDSFHNAGGAVDVHLGSPPAGARPRSSGTGHRVGRPGRP